MKLTYKTVDEIPSCLFYALFKYNEDFTFEYFPSEKLTVCEDSISVPLPLFGTVKIEGEQLQEIKKVHEPINIIKKMKKNPQNTYCACTITDTGSLGFFLIYEPGSEHKAHIRLLDEVKELFIKSTNMTTVEEFESALYNTFKYLESTGKDNVTMNEYIVQMQEWINTDKPLFQNNII